jgi:hypothetical protein
MNPTVTVRLIAQICHEARRATRLAVGDDTVKHWEDAEKWQKKSGWLVIAFYVDNGQALRAKHAEWAERLTAKGWVYGEARDAEAKTEPLLVDFSKLPSTEFFLHAQEHDAVLRSIVEGFLRTTGIESPADLLKTVTPIDVEEAFLS